MNVNQNIDAFWPDGAADDNLPTNSTNNSSSVSTCVSVANLLCLHK